MRATMKKTCPTCKGVGTVPILPDNVGFLIARACQREKHRTWGGMFCGRCGGWHYASNPCPFCAISEGYSDADKVVFAEAMLAHRQKHPEVYDDAEWLAADVGWAKAI